MNMLGEVVREMETGRVLNYSTALDLSELSSSMYMVRFQSEEGMTVKRVMLR